MPKYLSGRSKVTPQSKLQSDRYRYLSIESAEPNLGDPLVGPSSIGVKTVPPGQQYIIVSTGTTSGERYWIPNQGGVIPGSISVFDDNTLVGTLSSITQLNFVGAAVSASVAIASSNLATIRIFSPGNNQELLFNSSNEFSTSSKLTFNSSTGLLSAGDRIIVGSGGTVITTTGVGSVGIGTADPTTKLHIQGDLRLTGTIYDYNNQPGNTTQILVKNSFGGLSWINQETVKAGAGGTYQNVQFHSNLGLVDGASNFVYDDINARVGIGSTQPKVLFDVLGISSFKGGVTIDNLNITGFTTTSTLAVSGTSTTRNLLVTGITTVEQLNINTTGIGEGDIGSDGGSDKRFGIYNTSNNGYIVFNLKDFNGTANDILEISSGIATVNGNLAITGFTTTENLQVYSSTTLNRLNVSGISTFSSQVNINNLSVTGVGTFDNIKLDTNTISTLTGNLILDSSAGTTQINDAIYINDATESTSKDTGSIIAEGGVGIEKNLNVGGSFMISGVSTFSSLVRPSTDGTIDLGGLSNRWNNVYANTFVGTIIGNADSATQVSTGSTTGISTYFVTFVDSNNTNRAIEYLYTDSGLTYNPLTDTVSVGGSFRVGGSQVISSTRQFQNIVGFDSSSKLVIQDVIGYGLNVKDFGATGDGSTDDRIAIQSGVTSAITTGKPLIFPPGRYRIGSRGLSIAGNVRIVGAGGTVLWGVSGLSPGQLITLGNSTSNIAFDGLKFESNVNDQQYNSWFFGSGGRIEFRNCEFRSGAGTTAPQLMQTGDSNIEETKLTNCYFYNTGNIWRSNYSVGIHSTVTIEGCTFDQSSVIGMNSPSGFVRGVVISNNQIKNISSPIQSDGGDYITITGNVFENVDVAYLPEQFARRVVMSDNMCFDMGGPIIQGWSQSGNFVITNNVISGRKLRYNQGFGFTVGIAVTVPWNVNNYSGDVRVYKSTPLSGGVDEYLVSPYDYKLIPSGNQTTVSFGGTFTDCAFKIEQDTLPSTAIRADDYDSYNDGVQGGIIANNFIEGFQNAIELQFSRFTWTIENNRIRNCKVALNISGDTTYRTPVLGNNNTLSGVSTAVFGNSPIQIGKINFEDDKDNYVGSTPYYSRNVANLCNVSNWDTHIKGFSCTGITTSIPVVTSRSGTLSAAGVSTITGISTASIEVGLLVTGTFTPSASGVTTYNSVVTSIGTSSITINNNFTNVGVATTTFTFTRIDPDYLRSADNQIVILPSLPYQMFGKLTVRTTQIGAGTKYQFFGLYDIRYDGTNFIYQRLRSYGTGNFSAGGFNPNYGVFDPLYISNGKLYFNAYVNAGNLYGRINFDFDGDLLYRATSGATALSGTDDNTVEFSDEVSYEQTDTGFLYADLPTNFKVNVTANGVSGGPVVLRLPQPLIGRRVRVISKFTSMSNSSSATVIRTYDKTNHKIQGQIPGFTRSTSTFTATSNQTTFSVSYDVGYIDVYVNGVRLTGSEYTATNGTSVVLATACFGGETVDILTYRNVGMGIIENNQSNIGIRTSMAYAYIEFVGISSDRWQITNAFPPIGITTASWIFNYYYPTA